jgi:adenosine deaminase
MSLREVIAGLPKVELHVHLEGSIQPETLLKLAERNKIELPAKDVVGLRDWFTFRNFDHFVEIYVAAQNIYYTEAHYTAMTIHRYAGIPWNEQIDALQRGFAKVTNTKVNLILDIVREFTPEEGETIAKWCIEGKDKGVVAIGLSGFEGKTPVSIHQHSFKTAKEAGLKCTAHAGETGGASTIREALEFALADRIGHGVRCLEDAHLVQELRDRQIHLEVNPTSNVCLGVYPSLAEHPFPLMLDEGLSISINSDDPPYFNTSLTEEWIRCAEEFELSTDILFSLCQGAVNQSFQSPEDKHELRQKISQNWEIDSTSE